MQRRMVSHSLRSAFFVATGLLLLIGRAVQAQEMPPQSPPEPKPSAPVPEVVTEIPAAPADWSILARAMNRLRLSPAFSYEGDIEINGAGKGITFSGRERVRFLGKRPGKARIDVMISLGDAPSGKRYLTISDGAHLWTHEPGRKRYSMVPLMMDDLTGNLQRVGVLGWLYFNENLVEGLSQITPENTDTFLASLRKAGIELNGVTETVDGEPLPVYTLTLRKSRRTFRFFVDPRTAALRRLEVSAVEKGVEFRLAETILRQSAGPVVPKTAFSFTPPPDNRLVARVPVELL